VSFTIWLENTRRTFRGARRNRSRTPVRAIRSRRLSWEAFEDRILLAGLTAFVDPDPAPGDHFGAAVVALSTGNVVITSPDDNAGGTGAGAVYLFNGTTGALISTLTGSHAGDHIGSGGVTALSDGNYVVDSPSWHNGAGAVTWGSGTAGVRGPVSATNSLVGSTANDQVGNGVTAQSGGGVTNGVTALSNGNYVVDSPNWTNGAAASAGAVTWGSGTAGVSGAVSAANSLVGSTANDLVGGGVDGGVTALSNGNYVVSSPYWANGAAASAGAVTWGSGTAGVSGAVSAANSLVGSTANDSVGSGSGVGGGVTALSNGNYVVSSPYWTNGAAASAGAVTWGSGTAGVSGPVSATNSLVGSTANDLVGSVTALSNGNYVVSSPFWTNGAAANAGAVTWGSGTAGVSGPVSATNSLVGSTANDSVGNGATALSNGNYVVSSPNWTNGAAASAGAVTWGSGTAGVSGPVSAANSLVGSTANDNVGGGVTALSNGNYVVSSPDWNNGAAAAAGAVTWGSGTAGVSGPVSATNSLVGSTANDGDVSSVTALSNGNYVVDSPSWTNGAAANAGAVTWGSGTAGVSGAVSATNSLVGSTANDNVGSSVTALSNGNYVVSSLAWTNGAAANAGAVTWGSGTAGVSGAVSATNSLVGSTANDSVGILGVTALSNGNYVVDSPEWTNGTAAAAGAVTWGSGTAGVSGAVSATNSLVGSTANDQVGSGGVTALSNGNYVVDSPAWTNGAAAGAGAVTWGSGTAGVRGAVSATNSLVGSTANDYVAGNSVTALSNGNYVGGVTALSNGNYVVDSPAWTNGAAANAGAVTWGSGTAGVSGIISTMNSAIGSVANSGLGAVVVDNVNGTFFAPFVTDGGGRVRVGSQATGFAAAPTPTLPQVLAIAGASSKKGLTSFTVRYNEPLSSSSASGSGLYQVFAAVTKIVKKHKETLVTKALAIRSVSPSSGSSTVTINLAKPFKGTVQVMVQGNITAANGASNSVRFTQDLRWTRGYRPS